MSFLLVLAIILLILGFATTAKFLIIVALALALVSWFGRA